MASFLLDTNHLSPLVTLTHPMRTRVLKQLEQGDRFGVPTPVLTEFLYGIALLPRQRENLEVWRKMADGFIYYSIDRRDAEYAAFLRLELRRSGRQLATVDSLVAALALRHDLTLLTKDSDFASVPELRHESWW